MRIRNGCVLLVCTAPLVIAGCTIEKQETKDLVNDRFIDQQSEIREAVLSIKRDIELSNIEGLQAIHLESEKFTRFGPRSFERQDVASTNESEAAFFISISNAKYKARDLKIDVFGDVGIATYYPEVSFVRDGPVERASEPARCCGETTKRSPEEDSGLLFPSREVL